MSRHILLILLLRMFVGANFLQPRSLRESTRRLFPTLKQHLSAAAAFATVSTLASKPSVAAQTLEQVLCQDSVSLFSGPTGAKLTLIGTAHISEDSVDQVRQIIRAQRPQVVMIELDKKRIGKIQKGKTLEDFGFITPPMASSPVAFVSEDSDPSLTMMPAKTSAPPSPVAAAMSASSNFFQTIAQSVAANVLGKALGQFYSSLENIGFVAGGEFKAAVEEGAALGSKVLLGDRDVDVTLSHLSLALTATTPDQFEALLDELDHLETQSGVPLLPPPSTPGQDDVTKQDISLFLERIKTRSAITAMTKIMRRNVPELYAALIGERDIFMADAITDSIKEQSADSCVAVVGFAHVPGMERRFGERGFTSMRRNCPL